MEFNDFVSEKVHGRRWHVCPRLTQRLRKAGAEIAIHPQRYRRWFREFQAEMAENPENPPLLSFEASELARKAAGQEWIGVMSNGTAFLPDKKEVPISAIQELVSREILIPSEDGLFPGHSQTYRFARSA